MENYDDFTSFDPLHITSFVSTSILEVGNIIKNLFAKDGKEVKVIPAESKDEVQKDARNQADQFITKWWNPKTSIESGIEKVYQEMKHYNE
jgi:nucleoside-diphosphate-sugar epimerase